VPGVNARPVPNDHVRQADDVGRCACQDGPQISNRSTEVHADVERQTPELRDYLTILWRRRWTIAITTVAAISLSLLNSIRQDPVYVSTAEVLVLPVREPSQPFASTVLMENEIRIASSAPVRDIALQSFPGGSSQLGGVLVSTVPATQTLVFNGRAGGPAAAQLTAQAYADAYLEFRRDTLFARVDAQQENLETLVADLNDQYIEAISESASATELASLQGQITQLDSQIRELTLIRSQQVGTPLQDAYLPVSPASPNHMKALVLGLLLGLVAGVGLALLRERLDPLPRSREEVEAATGMPILTLIPTSQPRLSVTGLATEMPEPSKDPVVAEAFRALRARVLFMASQQPLHTIVVTSSKEAEGKTTTAMGLAKTLAEAGKGVVFVAADLRRPAIDRFVPDARNRPGLSEVLAGEVRLEDAVIGTPTENLLVLPHGRPGGRTERGLATLPISELLEELRAEVDFVIIDTTPVLGVSDALDLVPFADGVIFALDAKQTTRSEIASAITELHSVGATMLGVVVTNHDPARFRPRGHYYSTWTVEAEGGTGPTPRVVSDRPLMIRNRPERRRGTGTSSMP
jgi:capsular exopolysaccharide synthesis family protein